MRDITLGDLNKIDRRSRSSMRKKLVTAINKHAPKHGITTVDRMAMFLANIKIESGGFRRMEEGLSYRPERLMEVWPSRFKTLAKARQYARNPKKLANYVYGQRMGNKGRANAGWLFRGSGPGQMTGYNNFKAFQDKTGIPVVANPELMRDPDTGTLAICKFWQVNNMNRFADRDDVRGGRKVWNGGYTHLKEVRVAYAVAKRVLASNPQPRSKHGQEPKPDANIRQIQTLLVHSGLDVQIDGIAGPKTTAAIKKFQRSRNLVADGIAGPDTMAELHKKAAPKPVQPPPKRRKPYPANKPTSKPQVAFLALLFSGMIAYLVAFWTAAWEWLSNLIGF